MKQKKTTKKKEKPVCKGCHSCKISSKLFSIILFILLAVTLIPLFLDYGKIAIFYQAIILPSLALSLLLIVAQLKRKEDALRALFNELTNRLVTAMAIAALAFPVIFSAKSDVIGPALLVTSAICYSLFLHKVLIHKVVHK